MRSRLFCERGPMGCRREGQVVRPQYTIIAWSLNHFAGLSQLLTSLPLSPKTWTTLRQVGIVPRPEGKRIILGPPNSCSVPNVCSRP
jgi:hypothetical protein